MPSHLSSLTLALLVTLTCSAAAQSASERPLVWTCPGFVPLL
jgi:hypothetical protein